MALVLGPGYVSFPGSGSRDTVCFFGPGLRVRVHFFGSGLRAKAFLSLAWVSKPGCVSFTSSASRARVGFLGWLFYSTDLSYFDRVPVEREFGQGQPISGRAYFSLEFKRTQFALVRKEWWQERKTVGHIASHVRNQRVNRK